MQKIWDTLREELDPAALVQEVTLWLPNAVVAAVTLVLFWLVHRLIGRAIGFFMEQAGVDRTAVSFIQTVVRYVLGILALVMALGQLGVDVTGLVASLGVAGLTVGFAAKDALSNIISGLFIFWDRPFVIGDLIEIGDDYGEVANITMRTTRVVTPDGRMLAIPNSTIVNSTVASYTNFPNLRLDIDFTIGVNEDFQRVRELLIRAVAADPAYLSSRPPEVVTTQLGDFNCTVQLRAWLIDEKAHVGARMALREKAFVLLREAGIDMPYETLAIRPIELHRSQGAA